MSDSGAAARREARKRRILENSQERLSKIVLGDKTSDILDTETNPSPKESDHSNGVVTDSYKHERIGVRSLEAEPVLNTTPPDVIEDTLPIIDDDKNLPKLLLPEDVTFHDSKSHKTPETQLFWVDCLFIVCLSVSVRLMYQFNMSSLFGECLFIPFITISLAKIAADPRKRVEKPAMYGAIIKASLILSGVPKLWLDNCFLYIQMMVDLGNDLALYLFSFIMTHMFLESFVIR